MNEAQTLQIPAGQAARPAARLNRIYTFIWKSAWVFFLVSLPITSFPFFPPAIGGGALVRPLAVYPLAILMLLVVLPRLFTQPLPKTFLPLAPFLLLAVASSLLSLLRGIEPALGITVGERISRALITLGLGLSFYLTVSLVPRTSQDLRFTLRWLYAGFFIALSWGTLQAINIVHFMPTMYHEINRLQGLISTRRLLPSRVSGMTYEPNWFAEQLTFLLLPWLLGSILTGQSVFPWRKRWLTGELLLLLFAVGELPFTFSRGGLFNLVALAFIGLLFFRPHKATRAEATPGRARRSKLRTLIIRLVQAGLAVAILAGLIYVAGTKNVFFARIWGYWGKKNPTLTGYFDYLGFGARFTYGETAFHTYEAYPLFGVGLGNYAFYFEEMLPDRPLATTPEVLRLITPEAGRNRLITAKNFYFRLLAETGLVGTAAFLAFLMALFGCSIYLWLSPQPEVRFWGASGLLGLIAFLMAALSFDSFAIPNMWVVFGLITAATWVYSSPAGVQAPAPVTSVSGLSNE